MGFQYQLHFPKLFFLVLSLETRFFFSFNVLISPFCWLGLFQEIHFNKIDFLEQSSKGEINTLNEKKTLFQDPEKNIFLFRVIENKHMLHGNSRAVRGVIKKEVKFPGAIKKNHMEFPWILVFILLFGVFRNSCQKISKGHHQGW